MGDFILVLEVDGAVEDFAVGLPYLIEIDCVLARGSESDTQLANEEY
jgi:hypothetical protein